MQVSTAENHMSIDMRMSFVVTLFCKVGLELVDDICAAHKRQCIVVYAHVNAKLKVQPIFLCDGRQVGALSPDVQVPPAQQSFLTSGPVGSR